MTEPQTPLYELASILRLEQVIVDSPDGRAFAEDAARELLATVPALAREPAYLDLLRRTGGIHAYGARDVSFCIFGFDEPGYGITSLYEGDPLDGTFFRFGDLMLPEYEENLVFAFDLGGDDRRVFATPGSERAYRPYAPSFEALITQVVALAKARLAGAR